VCKKRLSISSADETSARQSLQLFGDSALIKMRQLLSLFFKILKVAFFVLGTGNIFKKLIFEFSCTIMVLFSIGPDIQLFSVSSWISGCFQYPVSGKSNPVCGRILDAYQKKVGYPVHP
jgi:hypothetical protein